MTAPNDYSRQFLLRDIVFNTYLPDSVVPQQQWYASLDGWEAAPRRVVSMANIHDDGDEPVGMTLAPRQLTVRGMVVVSGTGVGDIGTRLEAARERFIAAVTIRPDAMVTLAVADAVATRAEVHSSEDAPTWDRIACDEPDKIGIARFTFGLVSPSGAKYHQALTTTALGSGLATPEPTASGSGTGGSLTGGTYSYRVAAVNAGGQSLASAPVTANLAPLATPGKPSLTHDLTGQLPGGVYSYRVAAVNAFGQTLASQEALIAFGANGNVVAITVAWAPVAGATGYNVYGRTFGGTLQKINTTPVTGTSFVDTGVLTPSGALPTANTTGTTTGSVLLAWPAVPGATGYNVYGRTAGAEQKLTPTAIAGTTYTDTGAATPSGALPSGGFATTVTNSGTWEAPMVLTVTGPTTNPVSLGVGARTVVVETAVPSGQQLVIDTDAKAVTLNGVERPDLVANSSQWPELARGVNSVFYAGGGVASLAHRHTYA